MATFTSLGVGSGLPLNDILTKLVALERKPLDDMQSKANALATKVSSFGQINSLMSSMQTAANALTNPTLWTQSSVTSSDAASVSLVSNGNVAAGNYSVNVQSLASSQTLASGTPFASRTSTVGSGTLTLQLGSWNADQSAFTEKDGSSAVSVTIEPTDTLQNIADKINGADTGVSATLVTDSTGVRLSLRSAETGEANGFRVQAADADGDNSDGAGLSFVAFDPPNGATAMQLMQGSADAKATINGIAVKSPSNALTDVVDGLTINLNKVTSTPVAVTATTDRTGVRTAITNFVTAYNAMVGFIGDQTKYDPTAKSGGVLQGDSAATNLQARLRAMVGATSGASSKFSRLSDIGLEVQRDGTLKVNDTKLTNSLADLSELKKAFSASEVGGNGSNDGFARRYSAMATQSLGVDGIITTRTTGLRNLITKNGQDQSALSDRVDAFQQRMVAQYTALDAKVAQLNSLSSYVTQQVAQWTKSSN